MSDARVWKKSPENIERFAAADRMIDDHGADGVVLVKERLLPMAGTAEGNWIIRDYSGQSPIIDWFRGAFRSVR